MLAVGCRRTAWRNSTSAAWKSWLLLDEAWAENFHSESTWGPPLWIPYSLMTVGMTLLGLQILMQVLTELMPAWRPARAPE